MGDPFLSQSCMDDDDDDIDLFLSTFSYPEVHTPSSPNGTYGRELCYTDPERLTISYQKENVGDTLQPEHTLSVLNNDQDQLPTHPQITRGTIAETQQVPENPPVTTEIGNEQFGVIPAGDFAVVDETQQVTENPSVAIENSNQQLEVGLGLVPAEVTLVNRKRKFLWEREQPFDDPVKEEKRKNAIKAKKNREKKNVERENFMKQLEDKDNVIKNLNDSLATFASVVKENQILKKLLVERISAVFLQRTQNPQT